jgi:hypothetical protein
MGAAWGWAVTVCGLWLAACGGGPAEPARTPTSRRPAPRVALTPPPLAGPLALPGRALAEMPNEQTQLHAARRGETGLLVARIGKRWQAGAYDARPGAALPTEQTIVRLGPEPQNAIDVGEAPEQDTLAALEPVGQGYLLAWLAPVGTEREIRALGLDESGRPLGDAVVVARVSDPVRWVDVLPNASGALVLWDAERSDGRELSVAAWSPARVGKATSVARAVLGWQVATSEREAGIAAVTGSRSAEGSGAGRLALWRVTPDGTVSSPVTLGDPATAQPDVQLAALSDRYLVAWTAAPPAQQASGLGAGDAHVLIAAVGHDGKLLVAPQPAIEPVGEQALATLVAASDGEHALLGWEPQLERAPTTRQIELCVLGADAKRTGERATLEFHAPSDTPLFAAAASGYAALTLATAELGRVEGPGASLAQAAVVPTVVRLGPDLSIQGSEPVRVAELGEPGIPQLMRSVGCRDERCTGLAIGATEPARIVLVELPIRRSPWSAAARRLGPMAPPIAQALTTVHAPREPVADLAAEPLAGDRALVAWVTHVAAMPGGDKGAQAGGATLGLRVVGPGPSVGEPRTLSERAISLGGVAVAAAPPTEGAARGRKAQQPSAVVAWVGPNNNVPQLFVTSLREDGSKLNQKTITQLRGKAGSLELSDVDIASDGLGGYVVAWSDNRDGNPEIYAAKISAGLERSVPDQRITQAEGSSAEVHLAAGRDRLLAVWADAREGPEQGRGAVYLVALDPRTLKKLGAEQRLFQSELNARTPRIAAAGEGFVVWWVEEPAGVGTTGPSGLRLVRLDAKGEPMGGARWLPAPSGWRLTSATVGCVADSCRGVMSAYAGTVERLDAFTQALGSDGASRGPLLAPEPLGLLSGGAGEDPALGAGDARLGSVYLLGVKPGEGTRVRRLSLGW